MKVVPGTKCGPKIFKKFIRPKNICFSRFILKTSFFLFFLVLFCEKLWRKSRFFTFLFSKKTSPTLTGTNTRKKLFFRSLVPIKDFSGVSGLFHCYPPPPFVPRVLKNGVWKRVFYAFENANALKTVAFLTAFQYHV